MIRRPPAGSRSLRAVRLQARVPRIVAGVVAAILCVAGLRAIIVRPAPAAAPRIVPGTRIDLGAEAYAQTFAHAYLTWSSRDPDARTRSLAPYAGGGLDADAGLQPGDDSDQAVLWTVVVADVGSDRGRSITVEAQTTRSLVYLDVPVMRTGQGFLVIADEPALVGPPATDQHPIATDEPSVDDAGLVTVARRAVANYLAGNRDNLVADLTPDALVSLPAQHLNVTGDPVVTWAAPGRAVAVAVTAQDADGTNWSLRYVLVVRRSERWYVRSIQVDPTFRGGS